MIFCCIQPFCEDTHLPGIGKKLGIITGVLLGLVSILVFCGVVYLETTPAHERLHQAVNTRIAGDLTWEGLSVSPFTGNIEITALQVRGPDKKPLARLKRLAVNIAWLRLLKKEISFSSILIESPDLTLEMDSDGSLNLVKAFQGPDVPAKNPEKSTPPLPFNVTVDKFVITDGSVNYSPAGGKKSISVSGLELLISDAEPAKKKATLNASIKSGFINSLGISTPIDSFKTQMVFSNGSLASLSLDLTGGGTRLKAQGSIKDVFKTPVFDVTMDARIAMPEASKLFFDRTIVSGTVNMHVSAKGTLENLDHPTANLVLDLTATDFKAPVLDVPIDIEVKAVAGFKNQKLDLNTFTALAQGMDMSGQGEFDTRSGQVAVTLGLKVDDLGSTPGLAHLKGKGDVTLSARIDGPYLAPEITVDLRSNNLGIQDAFMGNLVLKASLDSNGRAFIDLMTLENQGSGIEASGWADLFENNLNLSKTLPTGILFSFTNLEPSNFSSRPGLNGSFSGTGRVTGSLIDPEFQISLTQGSLFLAGFSNKVDGRLSINGVLKGRFKGGPDDWQGNLDIGGNALLLGGQRIDTVSLKTVIAGQTLRIQECDIQVTPEAVLKGTGWALFADRQFDLGLSAKDFPLKSLDIFRNTSLTGGRMVMDLSCAGTLETPLITSQISIHDLAVKDKSIDDMNLSVNIQDGIARLKGRMGALFEGEVRLADKHFSARADMEAFDLSPYFTAAGQNRLSGRLNGSITANGRLDDLHMIRFQADLNTSSLGFDQDEVVTIPSLTFSMADGRFRIPESGITILGKEKLKIEGEGELKGGIHFEVKGMIPFKAIAQVSDTINDPSGDIMVSASMDGTLSEPSLTADLTLERLGMSVSGIEQKFRNMNGTIKITPDTIHVLQFTGGLDDGRFDLEGTIGLNKFKPDTYDLNFNARQLFIEFPDLMNIHLNAGLSLSGDRDRSDLKGEIVVLEGRYFKEIELNLTEAAKKRREFQPIREQTDIPFLKKMFLDIDIRHREPFWVDNNLALLSIRPDLKLAGTGADPLINGRAEVDSGTITFQKKEFDIKKGIIDFINPYKIEPLIDMEATLDVRSWTLYLTVSGTPDNLDFNFSSIPKEQHADILSLLAFGKTTRELRQTGGDSTFSPDDILAEFVAGMLQEDIKEASGIDTLEIKPDHLGNNGTLGINVVVGKELSRQMTVKYGVDVRNGETVQRMTTDYKLLENLLMRGFQDTGGHFGGELTYRLEFR